MPGHDVIDRISLELARTVAAKIDDDPSLTERAQDNLTRWSERNADAPGLLKCYREWSEILAQGWKHARSKLLQENDEGQRLRQNSPFTGILTPQEVWTIKRANRS